MIRIILAIILFMGVLLESTIFPFPLTLIFFMLMAAFWDDNIALWAFIAGLALDLFSGKILGGNSVFFLAIVWISQRYRMKLHPANLYYQLIFMLLSVIIYSSLIYKSVEIWKLLGATVCYAIILAFLRGFFPQLERHGRLIVE